MIKYGKGIIDEQFLLNRLAQAAIDTYTMTVVLSRATRALNLGLPTADYEALLTQVYCNEVCNIYYCILYLPHKCVCTYTNMVHLNFQASDRVAANLVQLKSGKHLENFSKMSNIADQMCKYGGLVQPNPLNL